MDQKTVGHLHNGILHSRKREGTATFCNSMDGTVDGEYYAKWNKSVSERQIPYDLTYTRNIMKKNKLMNKAREIFKEDWKKTKALINIKNTTDRISCHLGYQKWRFLWVYFNISIS